MGLDELSAGGMLETVLLGGLHGDVLRIWRAGGDAEFRHVRPVELVTNLLGLGVLTRTSSEPNRFREVGLLDVASGTLLLTRRAYLQAGTNRSRQKPRGFARASGWRRNATKLCGQSGACGSSTSS
jgi:hypothetical protein